MGETLCLFMALGLGTVTSSPTAAVRYTLYGVMRTWNEARTTCETHGQVLLKLDSFAKYSDFLNINSMWKNNGQLTTDMWTGLHQHDIENPTDAGFLWYDCDVISSWVTWKGAEPDRLTSELCVRLTTGGDFRTWKCAAPYHVVCQDNTGKCSFEEFKDKRITNLSWNSKVNTNFEKCQEACLEFSTAAYECVAITHTDNTCEIYTGTSVYINSRPEMTSTPKTTTYIKRCVEGEFKETASAVDANKADYAISVCPSSTDMSSFITSASSLVSTALSMSLTAEPVSSLDITEVTITLSDVLTSSVQNVMLSQTLEEGMPSTFETTTGQPTVYPSFRDIQPISLSPFPLISVSDDLTVAGNPVSTHLRKRESSGPSTEGDNSVLSIIPTISRDSEGMTDSKSMTTESDPDSNKGIRSTTHTWDNDYLQTSTVYNNTGTTVSGNVIVATTVVVCETFCWQKTNIFPILLQTLKNFLNKSNLSSYIRSKTSAQDHRLSAKVIGSSGITLIIVVIMFIACMDLDKIIRAYQRKNRHVE